MSTLCPQSGSDPDTDQLELKRLRLPILVTERWARTDPGVQAVSHPALGCHYFPPGPRLPSQPQSITAPWPLPSYTAWWQSTPTQNVSTAKWPWVSLKSNLGSIVPVVPWFLTLFPKENISRKSAQFFSQAGRPSCHPRAKSEYRRDRDHRCSKEVLFLSFLWRYRPLIFRARQPCSVRPPRKAEREWAPWVFPVRPASCCYRNHAAWSVPVHKYYF